MTNTPNLDMLARVSRAVIHRLNFPKRACAPRYVAANNSWSSMTRAAVMRAKLRPLLSFHDCEEVTQTCALVMHASGALYRDKMHLSDWMACFRASRVILRIDRAIREDATDIATLDTRPIFIEEPERFSARRNVIARKVRYQRACIAAAFAADKSRQRNHNRRKALRFLRFVASQASACGLGHAVITAQNDLSGLRYARSNFSRSVSAGEASFQRVASRDVAARNTHVAPRPLKSFSQLVAKRGHRVARAA
jgi:hypothetical protein